MKTATILKFPFEKTALGRIEDNIAECDGLLGHVEVEPTAISTHYKKEGFKYQQTKDLDFKEIVKLLRKDINFEFPTKKGWKFSVRSERGRYCAIDVRIVKSPFTVETDEFKKWSELNCGASMLDAPERYTAEFKNSYDKLKSMVDSYNFDDSDSMTDYFHNRFYSHIYIDAE